MQVEIEGLTGDIRFNDNGRRQNYSLNIVEMSANAGLIKIAEWSDRARLTPIEFKYEHWKSHIDFDKNKTYVVTTIVEEPYIMLRKGASDDETIDGKHRIEGYCKDLTDLLAKKLGIQCE